MKVISYNDIVGGTANDGDDEQNENNEMEIEEENDDEFYE